MVILLTRFFFATWVLAIQGVMMNLTIGFKKNPFRYCVKKKTILYLHPLWDTGSAMEQAWRSVLEGISPGSPGGSKEVHWNIVKTAYLVHIVCIII